MWSSQSYLLTTELIFGTIAPLCHRTNLSNSYQLAMPKVLEKVIPTTHEKTRRSTLIRSSHSRNSIQSLRHTLFIKKRSKKNAPSAKHSGHFRFDIYFPSSAGLYFPCCARPFMRALKRSTFCAWIIFSGLPCHAMRTGS